jgi:hypothetical protein
MFKCENIKDQLAKISQVNPSLARTLDDQMGFITSVNVLPLIQFDPKFKVLVRCGNGRFCCAVNELEGILNLIDKEAHPTYDYVRDVSIPVL